MTRLAMLALAALAASSSFAHAYSPAKREVQQKNWIEDGRRSGTITWSEGIKLRREQRAIAHVERDMKSDGRLSRSERNQLHRMQDRAANNIAYKSQNNWRRWWVLPRVGR